MRKYRLAMGSVFRNETRYLTEWIEYHRLVGTEHVYLICNDDSDEWEKAVDVLAPYVREGFVTWERLLGRPKTWQLEGYARLLNDFGRFCEWLCLTDVDAFLFPIQGESVLPILADYERPDIAGLGVYCSTFGSSGLSEPPELQTESFVWRARTEDQANWTCNFIFRPARLERSRAVWRAPAAYRTPKPGCRLVDEEFFTLPAAELKRPGPQKRLRLNHYSVRSAADWREKVKRDWPDIAADWNDPNHTYWDHKYAMLNKNDEFDDSMRRFVPALRAALGE